MCGRYSLSVPIHELEDRFSISPSGMPIFPRYNIAPTQDAPAVLLEGGKPTLKMMRWGLVPSWAKDTAIGNKMINARAETAADKPSYRKPFKSQRCLVPADGFYEWRKVNEKIKTPMRIVIKSRGLFAMAGLWDRWKQPDGKELLSFTILTTGSGEFMRPIHERQPCVLGRRDESTWLDPAQTPEHLARLLIPSPDTRFEAYEVSRAVNIPSNDTPECIKPVF